MRFDLPDFDVFKINANANPPVQIGIDDVQYAHVGTVLFDMIANPMSGKVYVSNTERHNEVRFEGPRRHRRLRDGARPSARGAHHRARRRERRCRRHLNKHINYASRAEPAGHRRRQPGDAGRPGGQQRRHDSSTSPPSARRRSASSTPPSWRTTPSPPLPQDGEQHVALGGGGPTGLVLDEAHNRLYVLTRFDNSVRVVNTTTLSRGDGAARSRSTIPSPPASPTAGRSSTTPPSPPATARRRARACHIFGDFDSLAWDLGNPDDDVHGQPEPDPDPRSLDLDPDFHPMKGPMTTQSLRGMANHGPMHWRGDRTGGLDEPSVQPDGGAYDEDSAFKKFNVAFAGLLGRSGPLTAGRCRRSPTSSSR